MSRTSYGGPKLPRSLLDQVGGGNDSRFRKLGGRKAQRKAARVEKKRARVKPSKQHASRRGTTTQDDSQDEDDDLPVTTRPRPQVKDAKPLKSILKKKAVPPPPEDESDSDDTDMEEVAPIISRAVKTRLAEDDDEIAALERKLGIKGKKKSKALEDDGLDWLADGSDSEDDANSLKRKRPEDSKWLQDKRRKAADSVREAEVEEESGFSQDEDEKDEDDDDDEDAIENPFSDDEIGSDFGDLDSEASMDAVKPAPKRRKENPYVAPPTSGAASAKYIPPSMRKPAASDEEALRQLRRQIQGQLNRLSESNMLSIIQALEELYTRNARQHVTSTLVDLLVGLVADPAVLNDTFLILHAGFAAALYKIIGPDFGAQLLEKVVEGVDHFHAHDATAGKANLNLLAFTSNLYNFQLVGSPLLFDYIRDLLSSLSENNTELLLRIIRTSGQQLRQDDPTALKDIVVLLNRSTAEIGEANLSVRMKFMIETIHNLKNNRMKTGAANTALAAEHTTNMKKSLTSLTTTRSLRAREPLRMSPSDIRDSEQKGKWWLAGASFQDPSKMATAKPSSIAKHREEDPDAAYDSETPGSVNVYRLARQHGFVTPVRRALFVSIMSSYDYNEAYMKVLKLNLKRSQMVEIPRVITYCTSVEEFYNPFYALLAGKFVRERGVGKAFGYQLWEVLDKAAASGRDDGEEMVGSKWIINMGKFFGVMLARQNLTMGALRKLDPDYAYWDGGLSSFMNVLLSTILLELRKITLKVEGGFENGVKEVFGALSGPPGVSGAVKYALETFVVRAELAQKKKEKRAVERGCEIALETLEEVERDDGVEEGSEDDADSS